MNGIIACETLYSELEALAPDAKIKYIPQEYHEFPVNVPRNEEIRALLERYIADFESAGVDRIVVLYKGDAALDGIVSEDAPLYISRAGDCISVFLHGIEPIERGERKASGTYYLTRGWIDRGVDAYKLYRGFLGDGDDLIAWFERAAREHDDLTIRWPETDVYEHAVDRGTGMSREAIGRFFHDIVGFYDRVVLIDTGTCYDVHREYVSMFQSFIEDVSVEHGDAHAVSLEVVAGNRTVFDRIVTQTEQSTGKSTRESARKSTRESARKSARESARESARGSARDVTQYLDYYPPGTPVEMPDT